MILRSYLKVTTYDVGFSNCRLSNGLLSLVESLISPSLAPEQSIGPLEQFVSGNGDKILLLEKSEKI